MKDLSRRDFLKVSGIGACSLAAMSLTSCTTNTPSENVGEEKNVSEKTEKADVMSAGEAAQIASDVVNEGDGDYSRFRIGTNSITKTWGPVECNEIDYCELVYPVFASTDPLTGETFALFGENIKWSDDELTFTVDVYDNIYDSEGNHITADDIIFSYELILQAGNRLDNIVNVEKTGDYSIKINLERVPDAGGQGLELKVFSKAAYEKSQDNFATKPIGCGPYKLKEFTADYMFILEKNENFWATDEQKAVVAEHAGQRWETRWETLEWWQINEVMQITIALQGNEIDYSDVVDSEDIYMFEDGGSEDANFDVFKFVSGITYFITYNTDEASPLHDPNVRKAISYAIDGDMLIDTVWGDACQRTYAVCSASLVDYNPEWENEDNYYHTDIEKAKQLLSDAGYPDGLTLIYMCGSGTTETNIGTVLQAQLKKINVALEISALDFSISREKRQNDRSSWDLLFSQAGSEDYCWNAWSKAYTTARNSWGGTDGYYYDDEMVELLNTVCARGGSTEENLNAFHDYVIDHCLTYAIGNEYTNSVIRAGIQIVLSPIGKYKYFNAFYYRA